jgi:hypothetical protein
MIAPEPPDEIRRVLRDCGLLIEPRPLPFGHPPTYEPRRAGRPVPSVGHPRRQAWLAERFMFGEPTLADAIRIRST